MTEVDKEPDIMTSKGDMNTVAWCAWYRRTSGATVFQAQNAYNERVQCMPEPEILLSSGGVSRRWIKWYRMRKRVSTNIAMNVAKKRAAAIAEGKELPELHVVAWWK